MYIWGVQNSPIYTIGLRCNVRRILYGVAWRNFRPFRRSSRVSPTLIPRTPRVSLLEYRNIFPAFSCQGVGGTEARLRRDGAIANADGATDAGLCNRVSILDDNVGLAASLWWLCRPACVPFRAVVSRTVAVSCIDDICIGNRRGCTAPRCVSLPVATSAA